MAEDMEAEYRVPEAVEYLISRKFTAADFQKAIDERKMSMSTREHGIKETIGAFRANAENWLRAQHPDAILDQSHIDAIAVGDACAKIYDLRESVKAAYRMV